MNNNSNRNNNNSNNNNRRRGRNNNRGGGGGGNGGGGGIQGNRIDSRARGNAPQMLEKYRKLAHDASLNDDRVLTEYYLQFADHYFRVMADMKAQKDEQQLRGGARAERGPDEDSDYGPEDEFEARTRQYQPQNQQQQPQQSSRHYRHESEEMNEGVEGEADEGANPFTPNRRPERSERPERTPRPERAARPERAERTERTERPERAERPDREEPREPREARAETQAETPREPRTRKPAVRRPAPRDDDDGAAPAGLDASVLPPAIARADAAEADEAPVRKPLRVRTKRPRTDDSDETLEAVG